MYNLHSDNLRRDFVALQPFLIEKYKYNVNDNEEQFKTIKF